MTGSKSLILLPDEDRNRRKGLAGSILIHLLLLLLVLLPFIRFPIPPPGQQGILVSFGVPDQGDDNDRPETQDKERVTPTPPAETQPVERSVAPKETATERKVLATDEAQDVNIQRAKEAETRRVQEEANRRREAEVAQRRADEEARKKAEEEARKQAEYDQTKKQYGTLLSGSGRGETGTPGNQGSPDGDPNTTNLKGVSTGSGMVGGGLGGRGVKYEPTIRDNSQKIGRVVVNVCVDKTGKVISAEYTQRGSTTTDSDLRTLAEQSARKFVFTESEIEKQCGTITVDFKVQ